MRTFLYFLNAHPDFGADALWVLEKIEQTGLNACASKLVFTEVLTFHHLTDKQAAKALGQLRNTGVLFLAIIEEVLLEAARLRRHHHLRTADAIQIASALLGSATHFVTNDQELLKKKVLGIQLVPLLNIKEATLFPSDIDRSVL
jgi:predicted nucleic acid-binding protein